MQPALLVAVGGVAKKVPGWHSLWARQLLLPATREKVPKGSSSRGT